MYSCARVATGSPAGVGCGRVNFRQIRQCKVPVIEDLLYRFPVCDTSGEFQRSSEGAVPLLVCVGTLEEVLPFQHSSNFGVRYWVSEELVDIGDAFQGMVCIVEF